VQLRKDPCVTASQAGVENSWLNGGDKLVHLPGHVGKRNFVAMLRPLRKVAERLEHFQHSHGQVELDSIQNAISRHANGGIGVKD